MTTFTTGTYKLTYFGIPALAEPIRLLLTLGNFDWEDEIVNLQEWKQRKESTKYGQIPYLTLPDGRIFCQSQAIVRFVAKNVYIAGRKLYNNDPIEDIAIDEMLGVFEDIRMKLIPTYENIGMREELCKQGGTIYESFRKIELNFHDKFLLGDNCTLADFWFFWIYNFLLCGFWDGIPDDLFVPFPKLSGLARRLGTMPAVKRYYASKSRQNNYAIFSSY